MYFSKGYTFWFCQYIFQKLKTNKKTTLLLLLFKIHHLWTDFETYLGVLQPDLLLPAPRLHLRGDPTIHPATRAETWASSQGFPSLHSLLATKSGPSCLLSLISTLSSFSPPQSASTRLERSY